MASMTMTRMEKVGSHRKDEVRIQFKTRDGVYKLMTLSEYSRPSRFPQSGPNTNTILLRLSFASVVDSTNNRVNDVISFNTGKELYSYFYNGPKKAADLTQPIEKKTYKGPSPTCHEFNRFTAKSDNLTLLVGFTHGQIQLIEIMLRDYVKLFNDERLIDTTKVTCVRWVPHLPNHFLAAHYSGNLYVYDDQMTCGNVAPTYQVLLDGSGFSVQSCSAKNVRNPIYRWSFDGGGAIHEFAFSPCARYLAIVFANGLLRIFNYHRMELISVMHSYFGGLRCVAWSPDCKYVATGGEDDLITVWSFDERRLVCRGAGHQAWINSIAFDPYTTTISNDSINGQEDNDNDLQQHTRSVQSNGEANDVFTTLYRLGSVGDDTFFCLWELTEDVLKQRSSQVWTASTSDKSVTLSNGDLPDGANGAVLKSSSSLASNASQTATLSLKLSAIHVSEQQPKETAKQLLTSSMGRSVGSKSRTKSSSSFKTSEEDATCKLGNPSYPRIDEVPLLEPMVCKKIANDRLTSIVFREDCIVTACQDGIVSTWSRPGQTITSSFL